LAVSLDSQFVSSSPILTDRGCTKELLTIFLHPPAKRRAEPVMSPHLDRRSCRRDA
jgi:hypothetical protein